MELAQRTNCISLKYGIVIVIADSQMVAIARYMFVATGDEEPRCDARMNVLSMVIVVVYR